MYILKLDKQRGQDSFYAGMIGGLIVEISSDKPKAKVFSSDHEVLAELEKYKVLLRGFVPVRADHE